MLYNTIFLWLSNPDDYRAGLALLRDTGFKSAFTLSILEVGDDAYNRNRLEMELRKWLGEQSIAASSTGVQTLAPVTVTLDYSVPDSQVIVVPAKSNLSNKPAGVLDIEARIGTLMDGRTNAKASLRALEQLGNDEAACAQRLPYALTIKQNTRMIDELYSQLDFFNEHGYLPPLASDPALVVDERAELLNMRSYVSRYRGKLKKKKLTPDQVKAYTDLLNQYTAEKERLERKLKAKL